MINRNFKIGPVTIGSNQPVYVIAEAGVNHNGQLGLALKLIDKAAWAGAAAVKFQTFKAEDVVSASTEMTAYQKRNLRKNIGQLKMLQKLELKKSDYPKLIKHCRRRQITFLSTPHGGFASSKFLKHKVPAFKIGSGDLTNFPLLRYTAKFGKPMILSTGMATAKEIKEAVNTIKGAGNGKIVVLHCTTSYPSPPEEVNLLAMPEIGRQMGVLVGYSDHTEGIAAAITAVALGARIIEKHLTLNKRLPGPDHKSSIEPHEFKTLAETIKETETLLGDAQKKPTASEQKLKPLIRKSLVALLNIKKGEKFTIQNLGIKRPGTGIPPKEYDRIIGKTAARNVIKDSLISRKDYVR